MAFVERALSLPRVVGIQEKIGPTEVRFTKRVGRGLETVIEICGDWLDNASPEEIAHDRRLQEFLSRDSKVK